MVNMSYPAPPSACAIPRDHLPIKSPAIMHSHLAIPVLQQPYPYPPFQPAAFEWDIPSQLEEFTGSHISNSNPYSPLSQPASYNSDVYGSAAFADPPSGFQQSFTPSQSVSFGVDVNMFPVFQDEVTHAGLHLQPTSPTTATATSINMLMSLERLDNRSLKYHQHTVSHKPAPIPRLPCLGTPVLDRVRLVFSPPQEPQDILKPPPPHPYSALQHLPPSILTPTLVLGLRTTSLSFPHENSWSAAPGTTCAGHFDR